METVIDWSKAPESTTHCQMSDDNYAFRWLDMRAGKYGAVWDAGGWHIKNSPNADACIVPRPSLEWTGEGLPPVGTVCEYQASKWPSDVWEERTIMYISAFHVITKDTDGIERWLAGGEATFRLIRTPEQIAAEEREAAIKEMIALVGGSSRRSAEALYDAGYRKQVAP